MNGVASSRLRGTFAIAWLLALVITAPLLRAQPISALARASTVALLAVLAALYLYLVLGTDIRARFGPHAHALGVIVLAVLVLPLVALVPAGGMWWHVMYAIVAAGLVLPARAAGLTIVALVALSMLASRLVSGVFEPRLVIQIAIGGAAVAVRALSETIEELRAAREELAVRAVDAERLRIARELHDLLGHSLSLLVLKSELADRLLTSSPTAARKEVREIGQTAREALREVRDAVLEYRRQTLRGELIAARSLLDASGIRLVLLAEATDLDRATDMLFAATVRESVTNVIRHSRARECRIQIVRTTEDCRIIVSDDGVGSATPHTQGTGLIGIRERCEAAGAACIVAADDSGFSLTVTKALEGVA